MDYYKRLDVRRAILEFARSSDGNTVRECAFYNASTGNLQRYLNDRPFALDSAAAFDRALSLGAKAFYCSYWHYLGQDSSHPLGHDLVWIVRAKTGGLKFAKTVTAWVLEALAEGGVQEPWVKYSGQLGFDLLIPLESIPCEAWTDGESLTELQRELTSYIVSYLAEHFSNVCIKGASSPLQIKVGTDTCLLSELRIRRGLLLAPMSLNPESGLVSVPIATDEVAEFSVLDASPADTRAFEWVRPSRVAHGLIKYVKVYQPPLFKESSPQLGPDCGISLAETA